MKSKLLKKQSRENNPEKRHNKIKETTCHEKRVLGISFIIFMAALLTYTCVIAATSKTQKDMSDAEAMDIFKKTFPNFKVSDISKAPIAGLYQLEGGGNIIYFDPNAVLLIFGEILNKDGKT